MRSNGPEIHAFAQPFDDTLFCQKRDSACATAMNGRPMNSSSRHSRSPPRSIRWRMVRMTSHLPAVNYRTYIQQRSPVPALPSGSFASKLDITCHQPKQSSEKYRKNVPARLTRGGYPGNAVRRWIGSSSWVDLLGDSDKSGRARELSSLLLPQSLGQLNSNFALNAWLLSRARAASILD